MQPLWQPTATHHARQARAKLLRDIREFFYSRNVLEVDTPLLSHGTVTDVHLAAFHSQFDFSVTGQRERLYLQTSPEYAMKRLLCAQSGPIYQICKAFRHEGAGRWHNPEFTMLEWYRPDFTHTDLMSEVDELLQTTLHTAPGVRMTYQHAMQKYCHIDPLTSQPDALQKALLDFDINLDDAQTLTVDDMLQLLFSFVIEPQIGHTEPCFIYGFPASQAALARINEHDSRVADRFEVYYKGAELANGFYELNDAREQRNRFVSDNQQRKRLGFDPLPVDENLLCALSEGLPDCAGVALGIDRLLMLKTGATHIQDVLNFDVTRA